MWNGCINGKLGWIKIVKDKIMDWKYIFFCKFFFGEFEKLMFLVLYVSFFRGYKVSVFF